MSVQPWTSFGLPWLFDVLCGQSWPQGDEDAVRRCAQAWADAMVGLLGVTGTGNAAANQVNASVQSTSAEAFHDYWKKYVGDDQASDTSHLGELAYDSEQLAKMLLGHSDELEYTKLMMNVQLVMSEIQILMAIAQAFFTEGTSLLEVPVIIKIGQFVILQTSWRFLLEVLQMVLPDVVAQIVMLADGHQQSWDVGKTGLALGTGILAGKLGEWGQGLIGRLPWMSHELTSTFGNRLLQFGTHLGEGALNNGAVALTTSVAPSLWNYAMASPQQRAQIDLAGGPVDWQNLGDQLLSGGVMSGVHNVAHLYTDHSGPLTRFTLPTGDLVHGTVNPDGSFPLYHDTGTLAGYKYGTGSISDDGTLTVHPMFGGDPHTVDLNQTPYYEVGHDGTTTKYLGYGGEDTTLAQWQQRPSDGTVTVPGHPDLTVPKGAMVTYDAGGEHVLRAEVPVPGGVQIWEPAHPGDYTEPYQMVGRTEQSKLLNGATTTRYYDGDGNPVAVHNGWTGKTEVSQPERFAHLAGEPVVPEPVPDRRYFMFGQPDEPAQQWIVQPGGLAEARPPTPAEGAWYDAVAAQLGEVRQHWVQDTLVPYIDNLNQRISHTEAGLRQVTPDTPEWRQLNTELRNLRTMRNTLENQIGSARLRGYLVVLGADSQVRTYLQEHHPDLYRLLAGSPDSTTGWPGGEKPVVLSMVSGRDPGLPIPDGFPVVSLTQPSDVIAVIRNEALRDALVTALPDLRTILGDARADPAALLGRALSDAVGAGLISPEHAGSLDLLQRLVAPDPVPLYAHAMDLYRTGAISLHDVMDLLVASEDPAAYHGLVDHLRHRQLSPIDQRELLDPRHDLLDKVGQLVDDGRLTRAEGERLLDLADQPNRLAKEVARLAGRPDITPEVARSLHAEGLDHGLTEFARLLATDPSGRTGLEEVFQRSFDWHEALRGQLEFAIRDAVGPLGTRDPRDYQWLVDELVKRSSGWRPYRLPEPAPDAGLDPESWRALTHEFGLVDAVGKPTKAWERLVTAVELLFERPEGHAGLRVHDAESKMFTLLTHAFSEHRPPEGTVVAVTSDKAMCDGCKVAAQFLADQFGVHVLVADPPSMEARPVESGTYVGRPDEKPGVLRAINKIPKVPGVHNIFFHADRNGPVLPGNRAGGFADLTDLVPEVPPGTRTIVLYACDLAQNPDFLRQVKEFYGVDQVVAADQKVWVDTDGNVTAASAVQTPHGPVPKQPPDGHWLVEDGTGGPHPATPADIPQDRHTGAPTWHPMGQDAGGHAGNHADLTHLQEELTRLRERQAVLSATPEAHAMDTARRDLTRVQQLIEEVREQQRAIGGTLAAIKAAPGRPSLRDLAEVVRAQRLIDRANELVAGALRGMPEASLDPRALARAELLRRQGLTEPEIAVAQAAHEIATRLGSAGTLDPEQHRTVLIEEQKQAIAAAQQTIDAARNHPGGPDLAALAARAQADRAAAKARLAELRQENVAANRDVLRAARTLAGQLDEAKRVLAFAAEKQRIHGQLSAARDKLHETLDALRQAPPGTGPADKATPTGLAQVPARELARIRRVAEAAEVHLDRIGRLIHEIEVSVPEPGEVPAWVRDAPGVLHVTLQWLAGLAPAIGAGALTAIFHVPAPAAFAIATGISEAVRGTAWGIRKLAATLEGRLREPTPDGLSLRPGANEPVRRDLHEVLRAAAKLEKLAATVAEPADAEQLMRELTRISTAAEEARTAAGELYPLIPEQTAGTGGGTAGDRERAVVLGAEQALTTPFAKATEWAQTEALLGDARYPSVSEVLSGIDRTAYGTELRLLHEQLTALELQPKGLLDIRSGNADPSSFPGRLAGARKWYGQELPHAPSVKFNHSVPRHQDAELHPLVRSLTDLDGHLKGALSAAQRTVSPNRRGEFVMHDDALYYVEVSETTVEDFRADDLTQAFTKAGLEAPGDVNVLHTPLVDVNVKVKSGDSRHQLSWPREITTVTQRQGRWWLVRDFAAHRAEPLPGSGTFTDLSEPIRTQQVGTQGAFRYVDRAYVEVKLRVPGAPGLPYAAVRFTVEAAQGVRGSLDHQLAALRSVGDVLDFLEGAGRTGSLDGEVNFSLRWQYLPDALKSALSYLPYAQIGEVRAVQVSVTDPGLRFTGHTLGPLLRRFAGLRPVDAGPAAGLLKDFLQAMREGPETAHLGAVLPAPAPSADAAHLALLDTLTQQVTDAVNDPARRVAIDADRLLPTLPSPIREVLAPALTADPVDLTDRLELARRYLETERVALAGRLGVAPGQVPPVEPDAGGQLTALLSAPVTAPPGPAAGHLLDPVRDAELVQLAAQRSATAGFHDLVARANPHTLLVANPSGTGDRVVSPLRLARQLQAEGVPPDAVVRLLSSQVGTNGYPVALARALARTVVATDAEVFLGPGQAVVAGRILGYDAAGHPLPDPASVAVWRAYHPDGTVETLRPGDPRIPPAPPRVAAGAGWLRV